MNLRLRPLLITLALCACFTTACSAADPDIERLKSQIVAQLLENPPDGDVRNTQSQIAKRDPAEYVHKVLATLKPDGSWSDIDYADQTRGAWKPAQHTSRLVEMARIYANPNSPLHRDAVLSKAIHSALGYWLQKKYQCSNWWYNCIGTPTALATFLFLFEKEVTPEEKAAALKIVGSCPIGSTGQNRIWIASNHLRVGLLRDDPALVQMARDVIMQEIVISPKEGLQADFSFHQHGPMLQFGNYGLSFAMDLTAWADALRGTRWAISGDKLDIFRAYLMEGLRYVCWKQSMDINSCGRQIFRGSPAGKCKVIVNTLERMKRVDPGHSADYQAAIESSQGNAPVNSFVANKYFWRSDYMVDRRPGYYASVRMSSARVHGFEACNGENQRGYHTGDGALYILTHGAEYGTENNEIFPVWDWRKLPGITAAQTQGAIPLSIERNKSAFVGGVSDGSDGAAVLECLHGGVSAKKSWFFFNGRIACLGAGICSGTDAQVVTTVNQCLLRGNILVQHAGGKQVSLTSRSELDNVSWVWHDGIGYVFPSPAKATVGSAPQTGAWRDVFTAAPDTPITKEVFSLWLNHGTKPAGASYAYLILPGSTPSQVAACAQKPDVQILSNSSELQAVQCGKLTMAVFYKAGPFAYAPGKKLEVDRPCLLMMRETGVEPAITVADPTQKETSIVVTLNGKALAFPLPEGLRAGQSTH